MAWIDRFNRTYHVETSLSKEDIIAALQQRIKNASENTSWFPLEDNYKLMYLDGYELTIDRSGLMVNSWKGRGTIIVTFDDANSDITAIDALLIPKTFKYMLSLGLGSLITFNLFTFLFLPKLAILFFMLPASLIMIGISYLNILIFRSGLKRAVKSVLEDMGVNGELSTIK